MRMPTIANGARAARNLLASSGSGDLSISCLAPFPTGANGDQAERSALSGDDQSLIGTRSLSIRILIEWRRPRPTLEASCDAWADSACPTGRPGNRPRLTGRPGLAEARALLDLLFVLLYMLAAARRGLGWCDHWNHHQGRRVYGQCRKPDRKFAHASLLRWGKLCGGH